MLFLLNRHLLRFAIYVCNRNRPEGNQVNPRHKLAKKRWQKLPVPAEKVDQHPCNTEIDYVVGRRFSTLDEYRKNGELQSVRDDGQYQEQPAKS